MVDMGDLDHLMANTAYCRPGRPRTVTAERGPAVLRPLHQALPPDFHSLCEQQPLAAASSRTS